MILMTSFVKRPLDMIAYSVARWQPAHETLPEKKYMAPKKVEIKDAEDFYKKYIDLLTTGTRWYQIQRFIEREKKRERDVALCCWCTISQQRLKGYNTIMCHTIPLGWLLKESGLTVKLDEEREEFGIKMWV